MDGVELGFRQDAKRWRREFHALAERTHAEADTVCTGEELGKTLHILYRDLVLPKEFSEARRPALARCRDEHAALGAGGPLKVRLELVGGILRLAVDGEVK